jgi:hypothetical protein
MTDPVVLLRFALNTSTIAKGEAKFDGKVRAELKKVWIWRFAWCNGC